MAIQVSNQARRAQAERARATVAAMLSDQKVVIGRTHIRGDLAVGNQSRRVRLWDINAKPGTALDKVKAVYLGALARRCEREVRQRSKSEWQIY